MRHIILHAALAATFALSTGSALAADAAAGQEKSAACASCHGADGKAISDQFPNLAGQYADYLRVALKAYRDGTRKNAVMGSFATNLSDEDIADLAAYYASQSGLGILPVK
ncbi:MAG: cytochrome c [Gammaproteobacteria bacterium]